MFLLKLKKVGTQTHTYDTQKITILIIYIYF